MTGNPPGLVPPGVRSGGRVRLPGRDYYLYRGDVAAAKTFVPLPWNLRPNLWWPDDRAWCVTSEIDNVATYVGGTAELAAALLAETELGAIPITPTESFQEGRDYLLG